MQLRYSFRLGLDVIHNGKVKKETDESSSFLPLRSEPLSKGNIQTVSLGMQHSAVVTGAYSIELSVYLKRLHGQLDMYCVCTLKEVH